MFLGFVVKDIVPQIYTSNRTKEDVNEGILTSKVPVIKTWFLKTSGTPLTKMGHGIEQAIMRFVRSTSVTLKALTAMIQTCFGECNCWVQRQCIWELAITKVRSNNGKVILCTLPLKAKTKKAKNENGKNKKQQKQKQYPNKAALNNTVLDSVQKMSDYCLRGNTGGMYRAHQTWRSNKGRPERWSAGFLWRHVRQDFNSTVVKFAMATRTRDNTHKQTTFIIFFFFPYSFFCLIVFI